VENKGAWRMTMCVRVRRGLVVASLLLGVVLFGVASSLVASAPALAQSGAQIVVEGNRRVKAETIRSYFKVGPGERLDAARIVQP
jgi:outer membrane protein insertion porin family